MKLKNMNIIKCAAAVTLSLLLYSEAYAVSRNYEAITPVLLEYEAGPVYIFQNDGRYGPGGTRYSASDVGQQRNMIPGRRTSLEIQFPGRHRLILMYIPLDITTSAVLEKDIKFRDTVFESGALVEHRYLFDGYRASYLYRALSGPKYDLDLGGTLQVRNAEVSFREQSSAKYETENDIGMVFALKSRLKYYPCGSGLWMMFEADGFSTFGLLGDSVSGAIYDLRLALGIPVSFSAELVLGARLLGGGAKVKIRDIDNWGNYGALTAGLQFDLSKLFNKK